MATRPVFEIGYSAPYYFEQPIDFVWNKGLNINQKRKNVIALHESYTTKFPTKYILEISSKSLQEDGLPLSAFKLQKFVPSLRKALPVENIYQGGKIFENGGPCLDMYDMTAREAKKDERLHSLGLVTGFYYEGQIYPNEYYDAFYNWIYINALTENPSLSVPLLNYDAFTDIEYNPKTGTSCQVRSAAIFVSLTKLGKLDVVKNFELFTRTVYSNTVL